MTAESVKPVAGPSATTHVNEDVSGYFQDAGSTPAVSTSMSYQPTDYSTLKPIYVVTVFVHHPEADRYKNKRTWGWHPTYEDAAVAVVTNDGDIFECDYNLALIEETHAGSLGGVLDENRWWFSADRDVEGRLSTVTECAEPSWARNVVGYGFG